MEATVGPVAAPEEVQAAVQALLAEGIAERATATDGAEDDSCEQLAVYLSRWNIDLPDQTAGKVLVAGCGRLAGAIEDAMAESGLQVARLDCLEEIET